jgi:hypothetical protein
MAREIFIGGLFVNVSVNAIFLETQSLTVGLGILAGLFWSRRTGWSCGGIVTPGLLALYASDPGRAAFALALGAALTVPLSFVARGLGLYGRERVGAAMLLALVAKIGMAFFVPDPSSWIGWVIPGLIAADGERQGVAMTLCGAVSCALAASFATTLLRQVISMLIAF